MDFLKKILKHSSTETCIPHAYTQVTSLERAEYTCRRKNTRHTAFSVQNWNQVITVFPQGQISRGCVSGSDFFCKTASVCFWTAGSDHVGVSCELWEFSGCVELCFLAPAHRGVTDHGKETSPWELARNRTPPFTVSEYEKLESLQTSCWKKI